MNQQAIHPEPPLQGNQLQQNIRPPQFENGRALFRRLSQGSVQVYSEFKKLSDKEMIVSINSLQLWKNTGGPSNPDEMIWSKIYLRSLQDIRSRQKQQTIEIPGVFISALTSGLGFYIADETFKPSGQHSNLWIGLIILAVLWAIIQGIRYCKKKY